MKEVANLPEYESSTDRRGRITGVTPRWWLRQLAKITGHWAVFVHARSSRKAIDLLNDRMLRDIGLRRVRPGAQQSSWISDY